MDAIAPHIAQKRSFSKATTGKYSVVRSLRIIEPNGYLAETRFGGLVRLGLVRFGLVIWFAGPD